MIVRKVLNNTGAAFLKNAALVSVAALLVLGSSSSFAEDEYPEGCVSCHVATEGDGMPALRLDVLLAKIGHGRGGERTLKVPTGCTRCHASDDQGSAGSLGKLVHLVHFREAADNKFTSEYGGDCSSCHAMDPSTWQAVAKSGERNWDLKVGGAAAD
jgi:mono/diheme cytochrome c family protein